MNTGIGLSRPEATATNQTRATRWEKTGVCQPLFQPLKGETTPFDTIQTIVRTFQLFTRALYLSDLPDAFGAESQSSQIVL
jgi:hypothetical protein